MAYEFKGELLFYMDIGLVGTYIGSRQSETEKGYVHIEYIPLSKKWWQLPKKKLFPKPVPEECVYYLASKRSDIPGVESRLVYIYTGEQGSLVKDFMEQDLLRRNEELTEENRRLKIGLASSRQESEDARSGVNKTIASMKSATRQNRFDDFSTPVSFPPPIRRDRDRDLSGFEEF